MTIVLDTPASAIHAIGKAIYHRSGSAGGKSWRLRLYVGVLVSSLPCVSHCLVLRGNCINTARLGEVNTMP